MTMAIGHYRLSRVYPRALTRKPYPERRRRSHILDPAPYTLAGAVLQRRALYPVVGDWEDVGFAPEPVRTVRTWRHVSHAANSGYEYRVMRRNTAGVTSLYASDRTRLDFDGSGVRRDAMPAAPVSVSAKPIAGGKFLVTWLYDGIGEAVFPSRFLVFAGATAETIDYGTPLTDSVTGLAYVAARPGRRVYQFTTAAFSHGASRAFAVRSVNAALVAELNVRTTRNVIAQATALGGGGTIEIGGK